MNTTKFEQAVIAEIKRIREILQENDSISNFTFEITASGRVRDGDVKIKFGCGEYGASVTANSVEAVINEFQRRTGFEKRHSGLCLPNVTTDEETI